MGKVKVNIRDKNFGGEPSSCHKGVNRFVEWEFGNERVSDSCFITDMCLQDVKKASGVKRKIAWIHEPRAIHPHVYDWIADNNRLFDFVLTYDKELLSRGENFLYYPHGRCWINYEDDQTPAASYKRLSDKLEDPKLCSIIASGKNFTEGHKLRHQVINEDINGIDVYGYGYNPVESKTEALDQYLFSVTIENCRQPGYWTEKIVDCFATQTIPIYWGDTSVTEHFNPNGIIFFEDIEELDSIIDDLRFNGEERFEEMKDAVVENCALVDKYRIPEDWLYLHYPFLFT